MSLAMAGKLTSASPVLKLAMCKTIYCFWRRRSHLKLWHEHRNLSVSSKTLASLRWLSTKLMGCRRSCGKQLQRYPLKKIREPRRVSRNASTEEQERPLHQQAKSCGGLATAEDKWREVARRSSHAEKQAAYAACFHVYLTGTGRVLSRTTRTIGLICMCRSP